MNKSQKPFALICIIAAICTVVSGADFNRAPAGLIKGVELEYVDANKISLKTGYGESYGIYWEVTSTDALTTSYQLTSLTGNGEKFLYIYVDYSESAFPSIALIDSATPPVWNEDYLGFYNGLDRCIGFVWVLANETIYPFRMTQDGVYNFSTALIFHQNTISSLSSAFQLFNFDAYVPQNISQVNTHISLWSSQTWTWATVALEPENQNGALWSFGAKAASVSGNLQFDQTVPRKFEYVADASGTSGTLQLGILGYQMLR